MPFPLLVAKHKMSYSVIWEWLFSFDSGDGALSFNSLINIIPDEQMENEAIKKKWVCAVFFLGQGEIPEVCLLVVVFLYPPDRVVCSQKMTKTKFKEWGRSMIHQTGRDRRQSHLSFLKLLPLLLDSYSNRQVSNILDIFPSWENCDLDFAKIMYPSASIYRASTICWAHC